MLVTAHQSFPKEKVLILNIHYALTDAMRLFSRQGIGQKIVELVAGSLRYFERPDECHKIAAKEGYISRAPSLPNIQTTR